MERVTITQSDINSLLEAIGTVTGPTADLLKSIIQTLQSLLGGTESADVTVEWDSLLSQAVDATFHAEPAAGTHGVGDGLQMRLKIGR